MQIKCPEGWEKRSKIGQVEIINADVEVFDKICDSADLCEKAHCQYYDISREGTRRFMKALTHNETLAGLDEWLDKAKYRKQHLGV